MPKGGRVPRPGRKSEEELRADVESCAGMLIDSARLCRLMARPREGVLHPWEDVIAAMDRVAANTKALEGLRPQIVEAARKTEEDTSGDHR